MESLVTSLETSQALKAAGFPQESYFAWHEEEQDQFGGDSARQWHVRGTEFFSKSNETWVYSHQRVAAFTTQEIADQLPEINAHGWISISKQHNYVARYTINGKDHNNLAEGDTMAEALAALWLKLQEAK